MRLILAFILFFFSSNLIADEDNQQPEQVSILLPAGAVHNGDYFAMGSSVEISGTVNGDVYVLAQQVIIDGVVNGDVLGSGGSIDISGKVLRNCRVIGGQVLISGEFGNNVTAIAGSLQLLSSASIGGSLVAAGGNVDCAAGIGAGATIMASNLRVSSTIKDDLRAYVGTMRITSKAAIGGNVEYRSSAEASIDPGAVIQGSLIRQPSFFNELFKGTWIHGILVGSKILALVMNFLYTIVVAFILIKIFPKNLDAAIFELKTHPFKALTYGIMLLVLLPLAALVLLMSVLGVPFALTLIAANIIGFYTAKVYSIFWASNWIFGRMHMKINRMPIFILGTILYFFLTAIPVFGNILAFSAMLFGLGAAILAQTQTKSGIFNVQTEKN